MSEERTLFRGTAANVVGLAAGVVAVYGVQVLFTRTLPTGGFGILTVAIQVAFVAAAGSRFGMDLSTVRDVAIGTGACGTATLRSLVDRCAGVAGAVSIGVALVLAALSPVFGEYATAIAIGAASIPLAAVANTYLGATRGLKRMGPTLWVYWIGQPVAWMGLAGLAIALGGSTAAAVWTYDASWLLSLLLARQAWRRASAGMGDEQAGRAQLRAALRFGAPRAPSALLAQALFWADLWVLAHYRGGDSVDIYSAVGRIAQVVLLFLTSFNLLFSPFAADLHARGERAMLDALFKRATRWALMGTIPAVIVLAVAAVPALQVYGHGYADGSTALRILLAGQLANVATGSVGFVLIMVGRTRLDLFDNALGVALLVALAAPLSSTYGINGTAVAAAITLASVNALRLAQVHRYVGIQPYEGAYARLLPATAACAAAAVAAHLLTMHLRPFTDLVATCAAGIGVYLLLLPSAVSADERAALGRLTRRITQRGSR